MKLLKSTALYEGCLLELWEVGLDKFEIRINGKVKATEYDLNRALETFESFKHQEVSGGLGESLAHF